MDEDTTTGASADTSGGNEPQRINGVAIDDQGMAIPEPEAAEEAPAATEDTETPEQAEAEEAPAEREEPATDGGDDAELATWADNKGLKLDSDNAVKAAKMAREAERAMHKAAGKASELEKAANITEEQVPQDATPEQRDNVRVRNLELRYEIGEWKRANPDKLNQEAGMVEVLSDPTKRALVQEGYLSLNDVYAIAKSSASSDDSLKSQGKREALEALAHKQQAAVPAGKAVNGVPSASESKITPQNVEQMVASHDQAWFESHYKEINAAMAG